MTKKVLPAVVVVALVFYLLVKLMGDDFTPFIIYEGIAMLMAFVVYGYLAIIRKRKGAMLMVLGITLTILAAGFQAFQLGAFDFIWQFDHNGTYHLIQLVGLCFVVLSLDASFEAVRE
ncbi:MAG: hypothetical protein KZQ77_14665 [Candidatus Thiodiazotropha sp. (ex Notomyrtea botanica)]|nr:hypothetical protein [Candidatus Thiodiazotropha sp. (ex Notomyrtea botanica)]